MDYSKYYNPEAGPIYCHWLLIRRERLKTIIMETNMEDKYRKLNVYIELILKTMAWHTVLSKKLCTLYIHIT